MPTKEQIKKWLSDIEKDREWLGTKLGVSKRTVDNWLSSQIEIPDLKLGVIHKLMDVETKAYAVMHQPLLIQPTKAQFNQWNNAWRNSAFDSLEEWAIQGLDELAEEYLEQTPEQVSYAADAADGENHPHLSAVKYPTKNHVKRAR